jgi:hypothetical protein
VNAALMVRIVSSWASTQREHERAHTHIHTHMSSGGAGACQLSVTHTPRARLSLCAVLGTRHDGCACSLRVQTKEDVLERALQEAEGRMPATNPSRAAPPSPTDGASRELLDRLHSEGYISESAFEHAAAHKSTALQKAGWSEEWSQWPDCACASANADLVRCCSGRSGRQDPRPHIRRQHIRCAWRCTAPGKRAEIRCIRRPEQYSGRDAQDACTGLGKAFAAGAASMGRQKCRSLGGAGTQDRLD